MSATTESARPPAATRGAATRGAATRERLVATARDYLDAEGLDGLGLREIARRAGLSHGAPLRHFPTLAALLAAVAADGFRDLYVSVDAEVDAAGPRATGRERVAAASHGYVAFARQHPGVFGLMFRRDLCDTGDPDYQTAGGLAFGQLVALIGAAQAEGWQAEAPTRSLAGVLWGAVHGLASLELHGALAPTTGVSDPSDLVALMTRVVLDVG